MKGTLALYFTLVLSVFIFFDGSAIASLTIEDGCMEERAGFSVNCTANDVELSGVAQDASGNDMIYISDPCMYPGDMTTFTATFLLNSNANERYDVGVYFAIDGDVNGDGARSGECNISTIDSEPDPPWLNIDGDTCGDINKTTHNNLMPEITITTKCVDSDGDGYLNLPNCTSWSQRESEVCNGPLDAFPGAPSKCRCDDGFNVPVPVPPAKLLVSKTAVPISVDEPGAQVKYLVSVTNIGVDPNNDVTIQSLLDDIYGDISYIHGDIVSTTCASGTMIPADDGNPGGIDTYDCQFIAYVSGNAGDIIRDVVTVDGLDLRGNKISGDDDAEVSLNDVQPSISISKSANPTKVYEPGGDVLFSLTISNNSVASDPVTIDSVLDDVHGNLNGQGDCVFPQYIDAGSSYSCSFTAYVGGNYGYSETDTIAVSGYDDDGNPVSGSDSANVLVLNVPSSISMKKSASPSEFDEPGAEVTYTYLVTNDSSVDTVTIDSLVDDKLGNLNGLGDCSVPQTLLPGEGYSCSVLAFASGNAFESITNTGTASGYDDDNEAASASDSATVNILNVPPSASLDKSAYSLSVVYKVTVVNQSGAEPVTITSLVDDSFGDVTTVQGAVLDTNCSNNVVLSPNGDTGDAYTCYFKAVVTSSPHTNKVTATIIDDDGTAAATPSDTAIVSFE